MFDLLKKLFPKEAPKENWKQTIRRLGKELVPLSGEAETLQGELVRCAVNLRDEAMRNGWMNWDVRHSEQIEVLRRYLPDKDVFSELMRKEIYSALDTVRHAGKKGADEGEFGYDELMFLEQCVVNWCGHHKNLIYKRPDAIWLDDSPFEKSDG